MTTSAHLAGSVHELLDLALGEIAASNCEVFSAWYAAIGYLICHGKSLPYKYDCKELFLHRWKLGIYLSVFFFETGKEKCKNPRNLVLDFSSLQNRVRCIPVGPRLRGGGRPVGVAALPQMGPGSRTGAPPMPALDYACAGSRGYPAYRCCRLAAKGSDCRLPRELPIEWRAHRGSGRGIAVY